MNFVKTLLALSMAWSSVSNSAVVQTFDADSGLSNSNNSIANAQAAFTISAGNSYEILGNITGSDADYYTVTVGPSAIYALNISLVSPLGYLGTQDPELGIFNSTGNLIAYDDDSGIGGVKSKNAAIYNYLLGAGTYYFYAGRSTGSNDFAYTLGINIASVTAVPEPTSAALLFGGLGLIGFAARKKAA